jgi:hypothetical protein
MIYDIVGLYSNQAQITKNVTVRTVLFLHNSSKELFRL